jgi:hypothetical protein
MSGATGVSLGGSFFLQSTAMMSGNSGTDARFPSEVRQNVVVGWCIATLSDGKLLAFLVVLSVPILLINMLCEHPDACCAVIPLYRDANGIAGATLLSVGYLEPSMAYAAGAALYPVALIALAIV